MKDNTHPEYREVLFEDISCGFKFVTRSSVQTNKTIEHEGKMYPYAKIEVSSASHPFYTGKQTHHYTADQVGKFQQKFGKLTGNLPGSESVE
jgi:large subunit ribosomal protein L31